MFIREGKLSRRSFSKKKKNYPEEEKMVISKKTIVLSLALIVIICIVMSTTEATRITLPVMGRDGNGCTTPNCMVEPVDPYKPGCPPNQICPQG